MRNIKDIAAGFDSLTADDFDWSNREANGWERLQFLCDELVEISEPTTCTPIMFRLMERLDRSDLGTPGPLVHAIEKLRGGYESLLAESLRRKPSPLTIWMANRILNTNPTDTNEWLALLRSIADHPEASILAKQEAADFLIFQERKT